MPPPTTPLLRRWQEAGLLDAATVAAIERWEAQHRPEGSLQAPIRLILAVGALLLAAGLLLFIAAHWEGLGPGARYGLALALLAGSHAAAVAVTPGFPALATALHAVGSVLLGAGVFLAGQIFHLEASWPQGLLLWTIGAGLGWWLLRQWPQLLLLSLLAPAWLLATWFDHWQRLRELGWQGWPLGWHVPLWQVPTLGVLLLCLAALACAPAMGQASTRRVLLGLGGLVLIPATVAWAAQTTFLPQLWNHAHAPAQALGWVVAVGLPLLLTRWLRPASLAPMGLAAGWLMLSLPLAASGGALLRYLWWGASGLLLAGWGVRDGRAERINLGVSVVALTVLVFYFSELMDRLGRSLSLIGLGLLFLAGGWGLERLRRRLLARSRRSASASGSTEAA